MIILHQGTTQNVAACKVPSRVITGQGTGTIQEGDNSVSIYQASAGDPAPYGGQLLLEGNKCAVLRLTIVYLLGGSCDSCSDSELREEKVSSDIPAGTTVWGLPNAFIKEVVIETVDEFDGSNNVPAENDITGTFTSQYTVDCCDPVLIP